MRRSAMYTLILKRTRLKKKKKIMLQFFIAETNTSIINLLCSWWCWCLTVFGPITVVVVTVVFGT